MQRHELIAQIYEAPGPDNKKTVLLLDQSYQPVGSVTWRKAMDLVVWRQKAEPVIFYDDERHIFKLSVIRLLYRTLPHTVRNRPVRFDRRHMYTRDNHMCQYCGTKIRKILTIDHVVPKSRGGKTSFHNCVSACISCNNRKADRTPEEADMPLLTSPTVPVDSVMVNKRVAPPEWQQFLR